MEKNRMLGQYLKSIPVVLRPMSPRCVSICVQRTDCFQYPSHSSQVAFFIPILFLKPKADAKSLRKRICCIVDSSRHRSMQLIATAVASGLFRVSNLQTPCRTNWVPLHGTLCTCHHSENCP